MKPKESSYEKFLLMQVASGDEQAFRTLTHHYSGLVFKFIYQHLEDRSLAEEIVQDIFVKLWLTRETLAQIESFRSFLLIICRNHAFNALKKMVREKNRAWEWSQDSLQEAGEDIYKQEHLLLLIDEAVEMLPPQQQKAWILCRRNGLKYDQAADEMKISKDAIKKYLQYANNAIKKYVSGKLPIYHP
ncbi:RNA polymerase sigma-70 factor (ECF subfamily) [Pseudobacter ginsenosidimutans]|uniref:RNA polymerase sigma-70 factor (ECF subfamily) n=2 Tax=Pseudobacter ginsenosidimutans TaxID=661488 RepID=A0A4Q7N461_9BACT|nr:RNA polymerase sigma-70 factor (ECF subfamily) [Pseudobacter ginsenosidimutans]